ncbi:alkyl hydroperoxide reductase subunit F [Oleomonas cavernae]|uniref:Thioredoxin reductase n=1 Tax=Oleomonas cavernae TaxID=2320859 RepID=A0A418W9D4_9PROT|nr:alkyl hydroperoxide reductase subunit F [Oleomonas cavernae]RJF86641.1 alkyl hydroperoxide reductase subunit F [Oleomonas cavernae]
MLDADLKAQLKGYMERATSPIEIVAALDDTQTSKQIKSLLEDILDVSPLVSLREDNAASSRQPSFSLNRPDGSVGIRFAGLPMGHEFTSLVLALLQVGGYPPKVDADTTLQIKALNGDYSFRTYISLTCQNCPEVVQALNLMAVLNPRIRHEMVDGALFQDEVEQLKIMAVPTVYLNGEVFGQGRMEVGDILAKLDTGAGTRAAARIDAKAPFDVLIVGGGPAGASAAIYAARKGIRTGVVSERFGGQVLDTMGIENFISVKETEGPRLVAGLEEHVKSYDVDIMNLQRAKSLTRGDLVEIELESGARLRTKTVILATGARWREMGVPGEAEYRTKGVAYCPHCDGPLFKGKRVAVIGGGNSGVEAAIDLAGIVSHVTLFEFLDVLRADAVLVAKLKSLPNVTIVMEAQTTQVLGDGSKVTGLAYKDRRSGESHTVDLEGIFVQIGLVPNTEWLKGGPVALTPRGEIVVDAKGQTSVPGVFAAGDVTTVPYKQIVIAMGEGSKAALSAFDHLIRLPVFEAQAAE